MARVIVGIGSNYQRERMIQAALASLQACYGELQVSTIRRTPAHGKPQPDYDNLAVAFVTQESITIIKQQLKTIEQANGRQQNPHCCLDIDLLQYDNITDPHIPLPHPDIANHAYLRQAIAELHAIN